MPLLIRSAALSATAYTVLCGLPFGIIGMILSSTMRKPFTPYTLSWVSTTPPSSLGIMAHEDAPWLFDITWFLICSFALSTVLISYSRGSWAPSLFRTLARGSVLTSSWTNRIYLPNTSTSRGWTRYWGSIVGFTRGSAELMCVDPRLSGLVKDARTTI